MYAAASADAIRALRRRFVEEFVQGKAALADDPILQRILKRAIFRQIICLKRGVKRTLESPENVNEIIAKSVVNSLAIAAVLIYRDVSTSSADRIDTLGFWVDYFWDCSLLDIKTHLLVSLFSLSYEVWSQYWKCVSECDGDESCDV